MSVSPPRPRGPALNALRAFEASARLGGFALAATELCVTPGAISQHVKTLEDWAGAELFERRSRGVVLTPLGREVAGSFSDAFDALGSAVRLLRTTSTPQTINIAALPSVGQLWLSPRLPAIRAALPQCTLSVTAVETSPNLQRELFDLAVFPGLPSGHPLELNLGADEIFPVCSARLAARLHSPADLHNEVWLYDSSWLDDWSIWIEQAAPELGDPKKGPQYSLYSIAVDEAINSAGVLIGHSALVARALARGELVRPFSATAYTGLSLLLSRAVERPLSVALETVISRLASDIN